MSAERNVTIVIVGNDRTGAATRSAANNLRNLSEEAQRAANGTQTAGDRLRRFADVAKGAALVAAGALVILGKKAVQAASDSEQSIGATETVFGKYAKSVIDQSKKAADAYGLSANDYRGNANLIGSLFKGQGVSLDQLAAKTDAMIATAADLSATFGGSTAEAVEALSSAFKGEFDPLERYGISLKASSVSAELARMGADKLTGAALNQATQLATTNLITKQAGSALGAFGRESDTMAHQQQVLQARLGDVSAELGAKLLPACVKVIGAISKFVTWAQKHQAVVIAVAAAVGVLTLGVLALNLAMYANPIGLVVLALAALVAAFVYAYQKSNTFRAVVIAVFRTVTTAILSAVSSILGAVDTFLGSLQNALEVASKIPGIGNKFDGMKEAVGRARGQVQGLKGNIDGLKDKVVDITVNQRIKTFGSLQSYRGKAADDVLLSADSSGWSAVEGGWASRTSGPTSVNVTAGATNVNTVVQLDGQFIRSIARSEVKAELSRSAHAAQYGRR